MSFLSRIFSATIGPLINRLMKRAVRALAFGIAALIFFVGLLAFLMTAGFAWLRTYFPEDEAALIAAGVMLLLVILCILPLAFGRPRQPAQTQAAEQVAPIVQLLKAAGLHGEAAGLLAGTQLAPRIRPIYLVATAVIVGILIGRKIDSRPPPEKS